MRRTLTSRSEYAALDLARSWRIAALFVFALAASPLTAHATPVISAANIPHSGFAPGGVNMATGELIIVVKG